MKEDKILTKKVLKEKLKKYEGILSPSIIEYLNDLIDLKYSVLREDKIDNKTRHMVSNIDIYNDIINFNIYEGAMKIFSNNKNKYKLQVFSKDSKMKTYLSVKGLINNEVFDVFSYYDGNINLYSFEENDSYWQDKINELEFKIKRIDESIKEELPERKYEDYIKRKRIKKMFEREIEFIKNRGDLSENDKYIAEVMNYYADIFLNEYGIDNMDENECTNPSPTLLPEKEFIKDYSKIKVRKKTYYF